MNVAVIVNQKWEDMTEEFTQSVLDELGALNNTNESYNNNDDDLEEVAEEIKQAYLDELGVLNQQILDFINEVTQNNKPIED